MAPKRLPQKPLPPIWRRITFTWWLLPEPPNMPLSPHPCWRLSRVVSRRLRHRSPAPGCGGGWSGGASARREGTSARRRRLPGGRRVGLVGLAALRPGRPEQALDHRMLREPTQEPADQPVRRRHVPPARCRGCRRSRCLGIPLGSREYGGRHRGHVARRLRHRCRSRRPRRRADPSVPGAGLAS
jgi:hypothetical protein